MGFRHFFFCKEMNLACKSMLSADFLMSTGRSPVVNQAVLSGSLYKLILFPPSVQNEMPESGALFFPCLVLWLERGSESGVVQAHRSGQSWHPRVGRGAETISSPVLPTASCSWGPSVCMRAPPSGAGRRKGGQREWNFWCTRHVVSISLDC